MRQSTVRLVIALGLLLALAFAAHLVGPGPDPTPASHPGAAPSSAGA